MKKILLLVITGFLLNLPIQAANFLYSDNYKAFYRADPSIVKLIIDDTFSDEFKTLIESDVKKY